MNNKLVNKKDSINNISEVIDMNKFNKKEIVKISFKIIKIALIVITLLISNNVISFADSDPLTVINNLSEFIFGIIRAVGMITLGFGITQVGLSLKSHDPAQRANGLMTVAGGVIITFTKEILNLIVG